MQQRDENLFLQDFPAKFFDFSYLFHVITGIFVVIFPCIISHQYKAENS